MIDDSRKEYILCAAIKRLVPREASPYHEGQNDICKIEIGYRHHDIFARFPGEVSKNPKDQGFYTSQGRFVRRTEAMRVAYWANQVSPDKAFVKGTTMETLNKAIENYYYNGLDESYLDGCFNKLYSEDLY